MNAQLPWSGHLKKTLMLGLPLVGSHMLRMSIGVTDTLMLGWYGVAELAASVLATSVLFVLSNIPMGFALAIMPMVANSEGEGDVTQVRRTVRMGLWLTALSSLCLMPILWFFEPLLLLLGQSPELALMAQDYMRIAMWGMLANMLIVVYNSYLSAMERAQIVFWSTLVTAIVNGLLNYALIFGHWGAPELGIRGAAVASVITTTAGFLFLTAYVHRSKALQKYEIFVRFWRADWEAFGEVFRIGWPIGLTILSETFMFVGAALLMGLIGTVELAAHGIVLQVAALSFMMYLGLANVGTIRAGNAYGRRDQVGILRAGWTVIWLQVGIAFAVSAVFLLWPELIIGLFLDPAQADASAVMTYGVTLLLMAAIFQIVDGLQVIGVNLLRGIKDTRVPLILASISYWVIGLPAAYILGFPLGYGGVGIWSGLVIGLTIAAIVMLWRFFAIMRRGL